MLHNRISAKCPALATVDLETMIIKIKQYCMHTYNILRETIRQEERKMIQAAAIVDRLSTVKILLKLKTNIEQTEVTSSIRKSHIIVKAISWEKRKEEGFVMGKVGPEKSVIPCVYALLRNKETSTDTKW